MPPDIVMRVLLPADTGKIDIMRYLLMLYAAERVGLAMPPEQMAGFMEQMYAYREALAKAGAFVATAPLMPTSDACVIRVQDGATSVQDGPYAETREQLGGYYQIEAKNLDEALGLAARIPGARYGSVEVRPIWVLGER